MKKNNGIHLITITLITALGGFLFGYDTGVIGGTQLYFTEYLGLSPSAQGWAVSSALYGCLFGAAIAGYLSNKFSRKYSLIISAVLFIVSAFGSGIAESLVELSIYRLIGGLGVGIASMTSPMYIAEISPAKQRGKLVSLYQLAIVIGFFVVFLATYFIGGKGSVDTIEQLHSYNVNEGWRVMFWSELVPAVAFGLFLLTIPHSPRWLLLKSRETEARNVLRKIVCDENEVEIEIKEIAKSLSGTRKFDFRAVFAKGMKFVLFLGVMMAILQQVTGINAILYYGAEIFSNALGYGPEDALKQQVLLGAVNFLFTFVAIFTVDKWGRKPLLIVGTIGMFISLTVLGFSIYLQKLGTISLLAMLTFIASFALSLGPVVWVLISEIFPNKVRDMGMSIATAAMWLFNAIVANSFPVINSSAFNNQVFNGSLPYFIFAALCIVTFIFVLKYIPETKGRTLEEIGMDINSHR